MQVNKVRLKINMEPTKNLRSRVKFIILQQEHKTQSRNSHLLELEIVVGMTVLKMPIFDGAFKTGVSNPYKGNILWQFSMAGVSNSK